MKKLYIIFLLIIFISKPIYSQNTFEIVIDSPLDDRPIDIIEEYNGNFIITARKIDYYTTPVSYHTYLFKIDYKGNLLNDTIIKYNNDCEISNIIKTSDNNYIGLGTAKSDTSDKFNFWVIKFDSVFNISLDKKYYTNYTSGIQSLIDNNENIVLTGCYKKNHSEPMDSLDIFMFKLSQNGDSLQSKYFEDYGLDFISDIIEKKDSTGYYIFTYGYNFTLGQIIEIDTYFNMVSIDSVPRGIYDCIKAKWLTDTSYILTGKKHWDGEGTFGYDMGVLIIDDKTKDVIHENYFGKADTIEFPGFVDSFDFTDTSNIYYGGTSSFYLTYFADSPSWLILNKLDSKLNLKWQKFYGGDAYYILKNILATQDGGCLLLGTRYDHNTQYYEKAIYILKVNENGELTSVNEPTIKVSEIIIYPNPGYDKLYIRTALKENILFELYNITGKIILKQEINKNITTINVNFLPSGLYFYRFLNEHKIIESGKWVKQ